MMIFKTVKKDKRGMALIIVLTASFLALVMIGVGATLLSSNIDKLTSVINRNKTNENIQSGFERVRALGKVSPTYLASCNTGDCINTTDATCVACANGVIDLGNGNRQKVEITNITQPYEGGPGFVAGVVNILVTGYYKNLASQRSFSSCLNYCTVAGRNCGDNGCGGSCGTCTLPDTCAGGGVTGVCGNAGAVCPNDPNVECDGVCVEGETCGGGKVIDSVNHIIGIGGGCTDISGTGCGTGADTLSLYWDSVNYGVSGATDAANGSTNAETLRTLNGGGVVDTWFEAVKFCDDLEFAGFNSWYLPASDELNLMYTAVGNGWLTDFAATNYWTSTEVNSKEAYMQDFSGGGTGFVGKDQLWNIRCLRRW